MLMTRSLSPKQKRRKKKKKQLTNNIQTKRQVFNKSTKKATDSARQISTNIM